MVNIQVGSVLAGGEQIRNSNVDPVGGTETNEEMTEQAKHGNPASETLYTLNSSLKMGAPE